MAKEKKPSRRHVKCQVTKEPGLACDFYKAKDGKYYKTKEIYEKEQVRKREAKKIRSIIFHDYLNYSPAEPSPPGALLKGFKQLIDYYGESCVLETMEECSDSIKWALNNKRFYNDYGKAQYIIAILKRNIRHIYKKRKNEEEQSKMTFNTENFIDVNISAENLNEHVSKGKDISMFLEEDE